LSLCLVPLLGLGAAHVYSQHNDVIGALGVYLRTELDEYATEVLAPARAPVQWDSSAALAELRSHRTSALWSSLTLVLLPQLAALAAATAALPPKSAAVFGIVLGAVACAYSATILVISYRRRTASAKQLVERQQARGSRSAAPGHLRPTDGQEPVAET
jgi:hypothetical protein